MRKTFVISAFPACGKSYCYNNYQDEFSMLDSDSSDFSWIKDAKGENTKVRNPEFPNNYMEHIKRNIGSVDIIFVSSHEAVRKALSENNIDTVIVYPNKNLKKEWIRRFENRGNDKEFIDFISNNWDNFINDIENEDNKFYKYELKKNDSYIDLEFLQNLHNI